MPLCLFPQRSGAQVEVRAEQLEKALGDTLVNVEERSQCRIESLDGARSIGDDVSVTLPPHRAGHRQRVHSRWHIAASHRRRANGGEAHGGRTWWGCFFNPRPTSSALRHPCPTASSEECSPNTARAWAANLLGGCQKRGTITKELCQLRALTYPREFRVYWPSCSEINAVYLLHRRCSSPVRTSTHSFAPRNCAIAASNTSYRSFRLRLWRCAVKKRTLRFSAVAQCHGLESLCDRHPLSMMEIGPVGTPLHDTGAPCSYVEWR